MKKTIFIIAVVAIIIAAVGFVAYEVIDGSKKDSEPALEVPENVIEFTEAEELSAEINVERTIILDKQFMAALIVTLNENRTESDLEIEDYKWYETCILMNDWLDAEEVPGVQGVSNVFQVARKQTDGGAKVKVFLRAHTVTQDQMNVKDGFWVEDYDMNEVTDTLITFDQAYDILQRANVKKPHSKHVVLRKAVGPKPQNEYNPQYIFGNADLHYYIDAVTGELATVDPSGIPEEGGNPYLSVFTTEE